MNIQQQQAVEAAIATFLAAQQKVGDKFIGNAYAHGRDTIAELAGADVVEQALEQRRIAALIDANFNLIVSCARKWVADIQTIVTNGYLQGESPVDIAKHISGYFGRMPGNWKVIARDQVAKAQVEGRNATYDQLEQEWVEITCAPDACDECTPFDGEIVAVKDLARRPQFHIQCACMDIPTLENASGS